MQIILNYAKTSILGGVYTKDYSKKGGLMEKEINKEKQENMKVHFKDFDIVFKTKTLDIQNDLPIIYEIFNTFLQEIYYASDKMKKLDKQEDKLKTELFNTLDYEQKIKLEKILKCEQSAFDDGVEQAFAFGLSLALQLYSESTTNFKILKNNEEQKK